MRAYTPVHSTEKDQETFQLLIKRYEDGQVSRFMHSARPGKKIEMRGPVLVWPGSRQDLNQWDEIGMVSPSMLSVPVSATSTMTGNHIDL
jgi:cytochrome-b5 reductase